MNNQLPWNFSLSGGDTEIGQSSKNEKSYDFPDSCVTKPNFCLQTPRSLDTLTSEFEDDLEDAFGVLADLQPSVSSLGQPSISIPSMLGICCQPDLDQSTEIVSKQSDLTKIPEDLKREQSDERRKRTRSAEVHNLSERRRRDRINKKLKILQELVPNCNKSDRASMLDDAIEHVKTLKHQVEIMQIFQAPYKSPTGIQTTQVPQFSQFVPIRPKFGMGFGFASGMADMCSTAGIPMLPVPAAGLHPSLAAGVGLSLLSAPGNLPVPQMQMPFVHSQQLPASVDTSGMIPNFVPGFFPAFSFSGQVDSGSQTIPSSATDQQLLPISQLCKTGA